MKQARVVIGSSFGDEGKGLLTDCFARAYGGAGVLVARFNGGAQAGHTVAREDGVRHVFSHFGAGTLAGAGTLLCRHFIANPILFERERGELEALGARPAVWIDPRALLTTPFDMLLNEIAETSRGAARHGSVGLGINETVTRSAHPGFHLSVGAALRGADHAARVLARIRDAWVPRRVAELGVGAEYDRRRELIAGEGIIEQWLELLDGFLRHVEVREDAGVLREHASVVFEGAQGLALDEHRGTFPHVTRSNTGIRNVVEMLNELPHADVAVTYATRAYLTRHGAGPLEGELPGLPFPGVHDSTNVPHPFQGSIRYALLDVAALGARIDADLRDAAALEGERRMRVGVAVTCLDQLPEVAEWTCAGERAAGAPEDLVDGVRLCVPGEMIVSRGPRASDVAAEVMA